MVAAPDLAQRDFNSLPPLNFVFQTLSADLPANAGNVGKIYINSTSGRLRFHKNSTTIISLDLTTLIADADIAVGAAIARSKLNFGSGLVDADIATAAAIARSKLNFGSGLVDADISASAAIALTKLATDPRARSTHTGTQLAATISDLITTVTALRLDQFAAPTSALNHGGQRATNASDAVANTDLTTLQQVNNLLSAAVSGQDWQQSVRVRVGTNVNIAAPGTTLDGVTMVTGNRVLLAGQTTASQNGIYVFNGSAVAMTRAADANTSARIGPGATVAIEEGTSQDTIWLSTANEPFVLDTTAMPWTQIGAAGAAYTAGTGLTLIGNTFSITAPIPVTLGGTGAATAAAARTALGVQRSGAIIAQSAALTAGTEASFAHGTGSGNANMSARLASTKEVVFIKLRSDATNIYVTADVAVTSGTLEFVYAPID